MSGRRSQLVDQASEKRDPDGCHTSIMSSQRCWTVQGKEGRRLSSLAFSITFSLQQSMWKNPCLCLKTYAYTECLPSSGDVINSIYTTGNRSWKMKRKGKEKKEKKKKASLALLWFQPNRHDLRIWEGYPGGQRDKGNKYRSVRRRNCHYQPSRQKKICARLQLAMALPWWLNITGHLFSSFIWTVIKARASLGTGTDQGGAASS